MFLKVIMGNYEFFVIILRSLMKWNLMKLMLEESGMLTLIPPIAHSFVDARATLLGTHIATMVTTLGMLVVGGIDMLLLVLIVIFKVWELFSFPRCENTYTHENSCL